MNANFKQKLNATHNYYFKNVLLPSSPGSSKKTLFANNKSVNHVSTPNSLNTSTITTNPSPIIKKRSKVLVDSIKTVSNFYDKAQITELVTSFNNVSSRIDAIDLVLKRREEMKQIEDQIKLERAAPIILKLSENFQKRIRKDKMNTTGNHFRKLISQINDEGYSPKAFTSFSPPLSRTKTKPSLKALLSVKNDKFGQKLLPQGQSIPCSIDLQQSQPQALDLVDFIEEKPSPRVLSRMKTKSKALTLLLNGKPKDRSPKMLVFDNIDEGKKSGFDQTPKAWSDLLSNQKLKEIRNKTLIKSPKKKLPHKTFQLARKDLEEDLIKYFEKNNHKGNNCEILLDSPKLKFNRLRSIESRAQAQFEKVKSPKKQNAYFLPTGKFEKKTTSNKSRGSLSLKPQSTSNNRLTAPQINLNVPPTPIRSVTSFRRVTIAIQEQPQQEIDMEAQEENYKNDESFASFTESRLDNLYRENYKLKKSLQILSNSLEEEAEKTQYMKVQKMKNQRENELQKNTKEIMEIVYKKIGH